MTQPNTALGINDSSEYEMTHQALLYLRLDTATTKQVKTQAEGREILIFALEHRQLLKECGGLSSK
jgi:hypothetical protein